MGIFLGLFPKNPEFWGCFGDGDNPNFGDLLRFIPKKTPNFGDGDGVSPPKMFGDGLGTGKPQILGIFGEKSPKNPKFRGGDGVKNLGDFYHTNLHLKRLFELILGLLQLPQHYQQPL